MGYSNQQGIALPILPENDIYASFPKHKLIGPIGPIDLN